MSEIIHINQSSDHLNVLLHADRQHLFDPDQWCLEEVRDRYDGRGWNFSSGDPEFWKLAKHMLVPGGSLLDIGIGGGSSSLFFALNGMKVVGVDPNPNSASTINAMTAELQQTLPEFDMQALTLDAIEDNLPAGEYDTVILSYINHLPSKEAAYSVFTKAIDALKPGGHLWVRAVGKHDSGYEELLSEAYSASLFGGNSEVWVESEDVIWVPCDCTGEWKTEPTVFFDPLDLNVFFSEAGCQVIHSQTIETSAKPNIMYGEDFRIDTHDPYGNEKVGGMITLLVRKPDN